MRDRERLTAVRRARADAAQAYFRAHAAQWDRIRKLHVTDEAVEGAISEALADKPFRSLLDLGTGTGRILELFGAEHRARPRHRSCRSTCCCWRARGSSAPGLRHCSVRQGDIYDLPVPANSFDVVVIHQVLHFLDDGGARDPRGGARAGAVRPPGGGRFRAARSGIPARGARPPPARLRRRDGGAMDGGRRPRRDLAQAACRRSRARTARSRCRSGSAAIRAS